jgi:protein-S-isoprenylcysteine O-methyltransferase Ste14
MLPVFLLIVLFGGGALFRRQKVDMDGDPPIKKLPFVCSKYTIIVIWAATVLHCWNIGFPLIQVPFLPRLLGLCLWILGFSLLFAGRFKLGRSFRIGSPKEGTSLVTDGLFRFSRNPMYVGVYTTICASVIYTLNPLVLCAGVFVIAVHHKIILAEERHMLGVFGQTYGDYCHRVRRYV